MDASRPPLEQAGTVHLTAAVLVPGAEAWEPIQAIRREHDPQVRRWMPHITLLYPFVPEGRLAEAAARLAPAAAGVAPFELALREFRWFPHGRRATVWLHPQPPQAVARLQARLQAALPWCDALSRFAGGFTPHLSVGRVARNEAEALAARLAASWRPVRFAVREVALIARSGRPGEPFRVRTTVPLGR
ncbi:MAG: 2'-5' RNA ligase family protein [Candidatus Brocadiia bacterium]